MSDPNPSPRVRAGETIRAERKRRGWSVETAARAGGIGHMTWRKIESGKSVHDQSLYAVDRAFEWSFGHTIGAVHGNHELLAPIPREASRDPSTAEATSSISFSRGRNYLSHRHVSCKLGESPGSALTDTFAILDSLAVPELKVIADTAHRMANEYGDKLAEISELIYATPRINWQDIAMSQIDDADLRTRCIEAWENYMSEYENITDIRNSVTGLYAKPVADVRNHLEDALVQAQETSQRIKEAAARFYELGEEAGALRSTSGTNTQG